MHFKLRKGIDIDIGTAPQGVPSRRSVASVAVLGRDYPGVRADLAVAPGDRVALGQTLFTDRRRPEMAIVAPAAGRISGITRGQRRSIEALMIAVDGASVAAVTFDTSAALADGAALRTLLLQSGAWSAFLTRPFGNIPDPAASPDAIFVTAMDSNPLAADAGAVLAPLREVFARGLDALTRLTAGPVFVCQAPGPPLATPGGRIRLASFEGPHPAGLAGTHIHHLMPVGAGRQVWQIGYQEVAAIGHLLATGQLMPTRVVSLAGPGIEAPALVAAPIGAHLPDLVGQTRGDRVRLISGSVLSGREAAYLGRRDTQVTVLHGDTIAARPFWHRWLDWLPAAPATATLPMEAFERAMPLAILPAPLMRALAVGDTETAVRLGCLELLEEDMALLSWLCPGRADYGALLREVLGQLSQEAAG